jgi:hypothetical protein
MGNKVTSFTLEAAQAFEQMYPGIMSNMEVLRDGTF